MADLPDEPGAVPGGLRVRLPVADLWLKPEANTERVSQLLLGAPLIQIETRAEYLYVEGPDAYRGWIRATDVVPAAAVAGEPLLVGDPAAPFYPDAETDTQAGELYFGTGVTAAQAANGRRRVWLPTGPAWLPATCLRPRKDARAPLAIPELLEDACRFLGAPYLWGGGTVRGIDCSGFVQALFRVQGRVLRRDAHLQASHGRPVLAAALEPGDLILFRREEGGRPTHIGIYLGDGRYIHAHGGDAGQVEITPLAQTRHTLWGARRLA